MKVAGDAEDARGGVQGPWPQSNGMEGLDHFRWNISWHVGKKPQLKGLLISEPKSSAYTTSNKVWVFDQAWEKREENAYVIHGART